MLILRSVLLASALTLPLPVFAQEAMPSSGTAVLQSMHDAYAGKWYHTLTFAQKTTTWGRDGAKRVQTWREWLRHSADKGTQLRIDIGDASKGNGMLFTADSSWRLAAGKLASQNNNGNPFLPMIEGVYVQPVAKTVAEIGQMHIDLARVTSGTWMGKPVWIVGAATPADTTSPQFWVDPQHKVVLRMILSLGGPDPVDIHLDDYVVVGSGMLATKVTMFSKGAPQQIEDYADWKVDMPLTDAVFNVAAWVIP